MKSMIVTAIVAPFILFPVGIQAQDRTTDYENVVVGGRTLDQFVEDVSADLDRLLNHSSLTIIPVSGTGVAQVLFKRGPDGKPTDISFYHKDNDADVNRLAVRAVSKIRAMSALPGGISESQQYMANIIVANSFSEYRDLSEALNRSEQERIAASKGKDHILAFNQKALARRN